MTPEEYLAGVDERRRPHVVEQFTRLADVDRVVLRDLAAEAARRGPGEAAGRQGATT